jgi:DNA-binding CsgD family transcriptional regulator
VRPHLIAARRNVATLTSLRQAATASGWMLLRLDQEGRIADPDAQTTAPPAAETLRRFFDRWSPLTRELPDDLQTWLRVAIERRALHPVEPPLPFVVERNGHRLIAQLASTDPIHGGVLLLREESRQPPPQPAAARFGLSPRETEVVGWIERGASDAEIADALVVSRYTVHKHLQNIYRKLGVKSRTAALATMRSRQESGVRSQEGVLPSGRASGSSLLGRRDTSE